MEIGFWVQRAPSGGPDAGIWETVAPDSGSMSYEDAKAFCRVMRADSTFADSKYRVVEVREMPS